LLHNNTRLFEVRLHIFQTFLNIMCDKAAGLKVLYLIFLIIGIVSIAIAIGMPYWRKYDSQSESGYEGIFSRCSTDKGKSSRCDNVWQDAATWRKAVGYMFFVCLCAAAFGLVWWLLVCIACCCDHCLAPPLPFAATIMFLFSLIPTIVYASAFKSIGGELVGSDSRFGFCFWLAWAASGAFLLLSLIGCGLAWKDRRDRVYVEIRGTDSQGQTMKPQVGYGTVKA